MAQRVRGVNNSNADERLATQADQATGNGLLENIRTYTSNIASISGALIGGLFLSPGNEQSGFNAVGASYLEDNSESARLKFQTQNIQTIEVTAEEAVYNINQVSDPEKYICAEINQISISGFNYSTDTALRFKFYFYNTVRERYEMFYSYVVGYGSPNYNANNENIKFFPNIVCDWNRDERRYGYVEIEELGTATLPSHHFIINITITPFIKK